VSKKVKRLFEQFRPEHYTLELRPDREAMTFTGQVVIEGQKTGRPSQRIALHQHGLTITSAVINRHDKKTEQEITLKRLHHHRSYDEVRLHTKDRLYPGRYTLRLEFRGIITRPMNGMYPCFFDRDGKQKKLIATQFESHHAREVFPCIDEPDAKATFDLTLITPGGETVIANTPVKKQEAKSTKLKAQGSLLKTEFETTPKMSTYLLAFVYGEMGYKEAKTNDGVLVRTYATPDNVALTDFALEVAVKTLEFYNDYFGITYPLPKCDLIALPDFASGAMENWGCITFREQCMLVDPKNSSLPHKQYVAMVVAHELAHQWFGNLVTMRWWTDLWLNEGFASWIEYMAVDHLFPEWKMWTQFAVDEQQTAMKLDALEHTHPIEVEVRHPDEIRTIFDTISYAKGASAIHMLHQYLGADMFREGLRYYLKHHEYGNTDTVDLWDALEAVSHKPVKQFMHRWTGQGGYPIITAEVRDKKLTATQQRFFINPAARQRSAQDQLWPVPLLASDDSILAILPAAAAEYPLKGDDKLKLNMSQSGFYRTVYNASHQQRLCQLIRRGQLEPLDRLGILSDAFEAAKAGHTDTAEALAMLDSFRHEDNAAVWDIIAGNLAGIRLVMDDEQLREAMKPYTRELVSIQLERLGWEAESGESYFDKLLRPTILGMASWAEEPAVVKEALQRFEAMTKPEDVHPDLRGVVYGTAVRHGTQRELDKLLDMHNSTSLSEERTTIAAAVTGFEQPKLIDIALNQIMSPNVRLQDVGYWVAYSFMNRYAKQKTWDWMVKNWDWLEQNIGSDLSFFRFPIYAARAYSDDGFLPIFKSFFSTRMSPAFERPINQGIEIIEWQSAWRTRDLTLIKAFFQNSK
jgi:aminopeptidase N